MIAKTIATKALFGHEETAGTNAERAMRAEQDLIPDPRTRIETERRDFMEGVTLRLLWAVAGGGDEGACAAAAIAVIRFAETDGRRWTDRDLRVLHSRAFAAKVGSRTRQRYLSGKLLARYNAAKDNLARTLFLPPTETEARKHELSISFA